MNQQGAVVVAASGLVFEAEIARGRRIHLCFGQGKHLLAALEEVPIERCVGVLSFGIAAGLDPALRAGSVIVASEVRDETGRSIPTDREWRSILLTQAGAVVCATILGVCAPLTDVTEKRRLFARTGAAAADMESHLAAGFAERHGLRFAALRAISDTADRAVPPVALMGLRADGSSDAAAVLRGLARAPRSVAPLARVAAGTALAKRALVSARRRLGPGFGLVDLG